MWAVAYSTMKREMKQKQKKGEINGVYSRNNWMRRLIIRTQVVRQFVQKAVGILLFFPFQTVAATEQRDSYANDTWLIIKRRLFLWIAFFFYYWENDREEEKKPSNYAQLSVIVSYVIVGSSINNIAMD